MATFSISGNVQAQNAKLTLTPLNYVDGVAPVITYSDSNGNYTFSGVAVGSYRILPTLSECTVTYLPNSYSYRSGQIVMVIANNLTNVNFAPVAFNAANPAPNAV